MQKTGTIAHEERPYTMRSFCNSRSSSFAFVAIGLLVAGCSRDRPEAPPSVEEKRSRSDLAIRPSAPRFPSGTEIARVPLVAIYPMPRDNYMSLNGIQQALPLAAGQSVLINLWSASSAPCLVEMKEFARREQEIRAAGIEIVALSVDLLGDDPAEAAEVKTALAQLAGLPSRGSGQAFPFTAGFATQRLVGLLQIFHDHIIFHDTRLPLPSSFLIDRKGRLTVIYKGPLQVDQLIADVQHGDGTLAERQERARPLPGRLPADESLVEAERRQQVLNYFRLADILAAYRSPFDEVAHFQQALSIMPDDARILNRLGNALARRGHTQEALARYEQALRTRPDFAKAHNGMGAVLERLGRVEEAVASYKEAVRLEPDFAKGYNDLGVALVGLGRIEDATAQFQKAIELKQDYADAHSNLGTMLERLGRIEEALVHFQAAVRINPKHANSHVSLARILRALGRSEEAAVHHREGS